MPVVSFAVARSVAVLATTLIFGGVLSGVGFAMSTAMTHDLLRADQASVIAAVAYSFVPLFAAQGSIVGLLDAYALGRFTVAQQEQLAVPASARARNPWLPALLLAACLGLPASAFALWIVPQAWPQGLRVPAFLLRFVSAGMLLACVSTLLASGRGVLRELQVPESARAFVGSRTEYLWQRHMLPQGLSNLVINAWVGVAIFPPPFNQAGAGIARELVAGDACVTAIVLSVAMLLGTLPYASFDLRWGVVAQLSQVALTRARRAAWLLVPAPVIGGLVYLLLLALHAEQVAFWPFIVLRALGCGGYAAVAAYLVASWTLSQPR